VSRPAIVFIGFMGAGKSTMLDSAPPEIFGEKTDIDQAIEREVEMSVRDYFDTHDETHFREVEEKHALSLLETANGGAIALGGGSVLLPRVREALGRHKVVWLDVSLDAAQERVAGSDRPLAQDRRRFESLFAQRRPIYEELADAVIPEIEPDQLPRAIASLALFREAPPGTRMLYATSESGGYPVYAGRGLLSSGFGLPSPSGRQFCLTDTTVGSRYARYLADDGEVFEIEPGEEQKTIDTASRVWRAMVDFGLTRHDRVIALGGGVVGDLAGFCAATYQRGVPVVQVPTTLVAQVDSAYGGKTGVDLPQGKNYVGAYHMPEAVIADVETLATLPAEELAAGFVEAVKTGLLAGGALWERVRAIESLDPAALDDVVFACARYKCAVVAEDERDSGRREVLNLGHTVGHAIEAASGYTRYRHGEAIGLGLLAALRLADAPDLRSEVEAILRRHGLPTTLDGGVDHDAVLEALQRDKKRTARGVGFVLLAEPGAPRTGEVIDPAKVEAAVKELYES
jgi:shikimate kinase / 3-dehydroquinate synthase